MFPDHITVIIFVGLSFAQVSQTTASTVSSLVSVASNTLSSNGLGVNKNPTSNSAYSTTKGLISSSLTTVEGLSASSKVATSTLSVAPASNVAIATFSVTPSSKVATSSFSVNPSSKVATSTLSVTPSSKDATSSLSDTPSSKVATSTLSVAPSSKVATSSFSVNSSSKVATSTLSVTSSSKDATSSLSVTPSSKVATSTLSFIPSSNVTTSTWSVIPSSNVTTSTWSVTSSSIFTTSTPSFIPPSTPLPHECSISLQPTEKLTCVLYTFHQDIPWKDEYMDKSSTDYEELKNSISKLICDFFEPFVCKVQIQEVTFSKAPGGGTIARVKVCLHLKPGVTFYFEDAQLMIPHTTNYTSEPVGVTYSEWKVKDGECKKCDGGGGPFVIESVCESKEYSCKGHRNKSQESNDCVKYCPSASSLVVAAVSNLILAMWISLFFNF